MLEESPFEESPLSRDCFRRSTPERRELATSASGKPIDRAPLWLYLRGLLKDTVFRFLLCPCKSMPSAHIP